MAVLSLPLNFTNSFWSQDYRKGLEVLYEKLEQGVAENDEIINFIRARATAEAQLASSLINPAATGPGGTGFGADDGASLLMAFRGLQAESAAQGQAHKSISNELHTLVADPFEGWAISYKERLQENKATVIDNWLHAYEQAHGEVSRLKHQYLAKTRRADEADDDAKFAPNSSAADNYTNSPSTRPADGHRTPPQRTASVSERIAKRLKEIQKKSVDALAAATSTEDPNNQTPDTEKEVSIIIDKGKGKEKEEGAPVTPVIASPPPMSPMLPPRADIVVSPVPPMPPPPMLLAGLSLPVSAVSGLLTRAAAELPLRPVRFPLLGEYPDCFHGEEFVAWLNENVQGFGGSLDRAEEAARDLTEREGLLRRIGEFGNQFEHSDDAFYQFRPKAFDIEGKNTEPPKTPGLGIQPENIIKRTNNFVNLVSKAINNVNNGEPAHIRARHEAEEADKLYRVSVRKLDRQRLGLEERIEETLKSLQRWESERLRAVKTVLLQYQGTLANLPKSLDPSFERSTTLIAAYQPESDLTALIERYRTGPFRPDPQIYESVSHDEEDVVFGIDLRKWAEGGWHALTSGEERKELVPPVLTALLAGLTESYEKLPDDVERRKAWIYEVPLLASHHLRETLNAVDYDQPMPVDVIAKYDAPVIASTIKLWILELNPPLALYEGWEEFRKLYPTVGSTVVKAEGEDSEDEHLKDLGAALLKLPRVHLYVLATVLKHLKELIDDTEVEEDDEIYITKLALSIGRTIIRPRYESEFSIQDRHPTLLFIDLVKHYDVLIPPTIAKKKRESERKVPIRKRTAPIDMRLSRSRMSVGADAKQLLAAQQVAQNPSLNKAKPDVPPPPPLPAVTQPSPPPPPPPPASFVAPPPPPPVVKTSAGPPRPSFREPPPEVDDLPPRPTFKSPPPENDGKNDNDDDEDEDEDDDDDDGEFSEAQSGPAPPAALSPPPPPPPITQAYTAPPPPPPLVNPHQQPKRVSVGGAYQNVINSRSPSPPVNVEDTVLGGGGRVGLSRSGSAQGGPAGVRGPRMVRGARAPSGGGNVSSLVSSLNRTSMSGSPPVPSSPGGHVPHGPGGPGRRTSAVLGRTSAFARRTMASDAEDEVVDRK